MLHLGAIRGLLGALAVIGTSLSPIILGWLFDRGVSLGEILYFLTAYLAVAICMALLSLILNPENR